MASGWKWVRVLSCTISPAAAGEFYDLALELQGPGTDAPGPPGSPYAGEVFAGIVRADSYSGDLGYGYTMDAPPPGGVLQATTGPIAIDQGSAPYSSITVSHAMVVRCDLRAQFSQVAAGSQSVTLSLTVNGSPIGSDSSSYSGGLGFWSDTLAIDVGNVSLTAGDVVSYSFTSTVGIGWTNFDETYLRVGRGTFVWGLATWVGP